MSTLFSRVRMTTATTGTGTMTLGAATSNAYFTADEAAVPNAAIVSYVIEDGTDVEEGVGTYSTSGTALSRDTVTKSKVGGTAGTSKLNLSGNAVVFLTPLAADITVPPASSTDNALARFNGATGRAIQDGDFVLSDDGFLSTVKSFNGEIGIEIENSHASGSAGITVKHTDTGNEIQYIVNSSGSYIATWSGNVSVGAFANADAFIMTNLEGRVLVRSSGEVGIIDDFSTAILPTRKFQVSHTDAATNSVVPLVRYQLESSGTPAAGLGISQEFAVETSAGNVEIGATIDAVITDAGAGSEDFDLVFNAMAAGAAAAERFRIKGTNRLVSPSGQVAHFWVYWTGGSTTILASHNVSSIDNDGTGDAGINLTTAFSSNNYAALVCTNETGTDGWDADSIQSCGINVHTASTVDVLCGVMVDGGTAAGNLTNPDQWNAVGFGASA